MILASALIYRNIFQCAFSKHFIAIILGILPLLTIGQPRIPDAPNPPKLVNDFSQLLRADQKQYLEQKLYNYYDSTGSQIVVVVLKDLEGEDIMQVATEILHRWGVGDKEKDNGVVLAIAPSERRVAIATGYGVQERLTDLMSYRIIREILTPNFKNQAYFEGIDQTLDTIFAILSGMYKREITADENPTSDLMIVLFLILFIILISYIVSKNSNGGNTISSDGWGSGSGWGRGWSSGGSSWGGGGWSGGGWSFGGGGSSGGGWSFGGGSGGGGGSSGSW